MLAALLVQVYYSRQLPHDIYGSYQNFWVQLFVFATLACAGIHVFFVTYSPQTLIRLLLKAKRRYYYFFFLWLLLIGLGFSWMQHSEGFMFMLPLVFLLTHSVSSIIESALVVFKRFTFLAAFNIFYAIAFCLLHYLALRNGFDLQSLFLWVFLLMLLRLAVYLFRFSSFFKANKDAALTSAELPASPGKLWFHLGLYDLLNMLGRWADKFIVSILLAESISGIYFNGAVDVPFIPLIVGAAASAVLIQLASKGEKQEPQFTITLANRSGALLSAIVFPLFFFLAIFRDELFTVVFTSKFDEAIPVFLASSLVIPLRSYTFTTVLQNRNKGAIINFGAVLDLAVAFSLTWPLYMLMGLPGIALSFTIATYVQAFFYLHHSARVLGVPISAIVPWRNWLGKLIVFAILFIGIHYGFSLLFSDQLSLIFGFIVTAFTVLIGTRRELRQANIKYGNE